MSLGSLNGPLVRACPTICGRIGEQRIPLLAVPFAALWAGLGRNKKAFCYVFDDRSGEALRYPEACRSDTDRGGYWPSVGSAITLNV